MKVFEQLEEIPSTQRLLLFIIAIMLVPGAYYYLFYASNTEALKKLTQERDTLKLTLRTTSARARRLPIFEEEVQQLSDSLKFALAKLPDKTEIPELLRQVSQLAFTNGIEFTLFKPNVEVRKDFYAEIPVTMTMRSDFHSVGRFFSDVSRLPRIVNLSKIVITEPRIEDDRFMLTVSCVATTYRFLPKAETEKADANKEKPKE